MILEQGFIDAGFPVSETRSPGKEYILPNKMKVRVMEATNEAPLRASFTNMNDGPINPFTGKPPQPAPKGFSGSRKEFTRKQTHLDLKP